MMRNYKDLWPQRKMGERKEGEEEEEPRRKVVVVAMGERVNGEE